MKATMKIKVARIPKFVYDGMGRDDGCRRLGRPCIAWSTAGA